MQYLNIGGRIFIKRVQCDIENKKIILNSDNPKYKSFILPENDDVKVIGEVIGKLDIK